MNNTCILCPQFFELHFHISRHIAHLGWETPVFFYTFYLVYIWHYRIKLFLRHLPNCPCSNFSRYVDLFQKISPRIAKQLRFWVKLHHIRRKCKNGNPGFFYEWITCNEKLRCAPNIFPGMFWREI